MVSNVLALVLITPRVPRGSRLLRAPELKAGSGPSWEVQGHRDGSLEVGGLFHPLLPLALAEPDQAGTWGQRGGWGRGPTLCSPASVPGSSRAPAWPRWPPSTPGC